MATATPPRRNIGHSNNGSADILDRAPPQDIATEKSLIGCMILDPEKIDLVSVRLRSSDFYDRLHGQVYDGLLLMREMNLPISDPSVLLPHFKKWGLVDDGFNAARIAEYVNRNANTANVMYYCEELINLSRCRDMISLATRSLSRLYEEKPDLDAISENLISKVASIEARGDIELVTIKEAGEKAVGRIRNNVALGKASGLPTGLKALDEMTGGMCSSELVILAARAGQGKSAMSMQIASNVAIDSGPVLFVSLEMQDYEIAERTLCAVSGITGKSIRAGQVTTDDVDRMSEFVASLDYPLAFYAPSSATVRHIRGACRVAMAKAPLRLLVVDYLQRVEVSDPRKPSWEKVGEVLKGLKAIAREFQIPVMALCQLNRDADGKVPTLRDLKSSGSIEEDADCVLAIHTPQESKGGNKELHVLKNRHGEDGIIKFRWKAAATRFEEYIPMLDGTF